MALRVLFFSIALFAAGPALGQVGTPEEQAARRSCWQEIVGEINHTPSDAQVMPLNACVTKALGRPDPYMRRSSSASREHGGNYGEEKNEFGVPAQSTPFDGDLGEARPTRIPGAQVVTTVEMEAIVEAQRGNDLRRLGTVRRERFPTQFGRPIWAGSGRMTPERNAARSLRRRTWRLETLADRLPLRELEVPRILQRRAARASRPLHEREVVSRRLSVMESGGELNRGGSARRGSGSSWHDRSKKSSEKALMSKHVLALSSAGVCCFRLA